MDRTAALNPAQREAVLSHRGPLLVLAGAGTGKTRVITFRTAELIRRGTPPSRILSVTFTNKAAREMQQRIAALLGGRRRRERPFISTFHALCVRILREEIESLGYPRRFVIYDRGDQESVARRALREIRAGDQALRPRDLLYRISRWKSAGITPERITAHAENDLDLLAGVAYRNYQAGLKTAGALDFDDLLLCTHRLFSEFPDVLRRQQRRFTHVQIDEYQDTNAVQFRLVEALVRPHLNLCVVGDDDQSIYGWRGADAGHILNFQSRFPEAKVVRLERNYRSTDQILDAANRLVLHNRGRHRKSLQACRRSSHAIRYLEFPDEVAEAEGIVREIGCLVRDGHVPPADIAILFRTNEQPRLFESELRRAGLSYVLLGSQSFFDRKEVRDLLAYLKVLANPNDDASLLRVLNTPPRGIGSTTVQKLTAQAVRAGLPLWTVLEQADANGHVAVKAATAIGRFRTLIDRYRRRFEESPGRMAEAVAEFIHEVDYEAEIQRQYREPAQQLLRSEMVQQFVESIREYVERADDASLDGYLEQTALTARDEEADKDEQLSRDAVKLMTLHSAKGLEFPRVYMVGMEENLLPHRRSIEGTEADIAEERRLAYVGITRAMDHLTLSRAAVRKKWGKPRPSLPSRFLFEMQSEPQQAGSSRTVENREPVDG